MPGDASPCQASDSTNHNLGEDYEKQATTVHVTDSKLATLQCRVHSMQVKSLSAPRSTSAPLRGCHIRLLDAVSRFVNGRKEISYSASIASSKCLAFSCGSLRK